MDAGVNKIIIILLVIFISNYDTYSGTPAAPSARLLTATKV